MTYNGWKNYQTWNVALWIGNEEPMYRAAVDFMRGFQGRKPYIEFLKEMGLEDARTPDGVKWISPDVDHRAMNSFMTELKGN